MQSGSKGFTVIEVIIFIAISGMLLMVALASVTSSVRTTRFQDDVNTTESYLQRQYSEVASGRNIRDDSLRCNSGVVSTGSSRPGTTTCVVLGRLLTFDIGNSAISSRYIVADGSIVPTGVNESEKIMSMNPTVVNDSLLNGSFVNPWGSTYDRMVDGSSANVNSLAIMRSPESGRMLIYSQLVTSPTGAVNVTFQENQLNQKVDLCLHTDETIGGRIAYINIAAGQGQNVIQSNLNTTGGTC